MISLLIKIFVNCAKIFGKNYEPGLLALRLGVELLEQLGDDGGHVLDDLLVLLGVLHPDLHSVLHLRRGVHRAHHRREIHGPRLSQVHDVRQRQSRCDDTAWPLGPGSRGRNSLKLRRQS